MESYIWENIFDEEGTSGKTMSSPPALPARTGGDQPEDLELPLPHCQPEPRFWWAPHHHCQDATRAAPTWRSRAATIRFSWTGRSGHSPWGDEIICMCVCICILPGWENKGELRFPDLWEEDKIELLFKSRDPAVNSTIINILFSKKRIKKREHLCLTSVYTSAPISFWACSVLLWVKSTPTA